MSEYYCNSIRILDPQNLHLDQITDKFQLELKSSYSIFLAGPIRGNLIWRDEIIDRLFYKIKKDENITIFNPQGNITNKTFELKASHEDQIKWETKMLDLADCILFNIPQPIDQTEDYARTTRFELGEWVGKISANSNLNKDLVIWMNDDFPGKKYIVSRLLDLSSHHEFQNIHYVIEKTDIPDQLLNLMRNKDNKEIFFM